MISAQTRSAFVARENRYTLFRIMLWLTAVEELGMPIKTLPILERDLTRARQIARSWKLDQLPAADVEIVARAIAQGIAEGRRYGLEIAQMPGNA
jgi:hypothetical protein